jgi:threonine/homoserine/homoserine lactone efflux protein
MSILFLKALTIGFVMATPVGPIGALCIQRSVHGGFKAGAMTGLGAASANTVYGLIAVFGLISMSTFFDKYGFWMQIVSGAFLLYLGARMLVRSNQDQAAHTLAVTQKSFHAYGTAFLLAMVSNPTKLLSSMAIFASLGFDRFSTDYLQALFLLSAITAGSLIWWLMLSRLVAAIPREKISAKALQAMGRVSGMITLGFGLNAVWKGAGL